MHVHRDKGGRAHAITPGAPFGPNILRSMHVTAVLTNAVKEGKKHDDPEIVNLFALATKVSKYLASKLLDDPRRELKKKLRRGKNERVLFVTDIKEFLRGFNRELCDRFEEEFPGTPDNVGNLVGRVYWSTKFNTK